MAIKVGGTEVIDNTRALKNITSVDATTVTALNNAGISGGSTIEAVASGSLSDGSPVVLNSDGTVSVVARETETELLGTATSFDISSSVQEAIDAIFDSTNNKVVIAYKDSNNSSYGTAVVGTVSGTSISFGTPVVFESAAANEISATFDSTNNKVVIAYSDNGNSNYATAVVGTVSGTSISFGTPVVFDTTDAREISTAFDSTNNKVVIAYRDTGNLNYGTAVVGTVSGTSISFGTPVVFATHEAISSIVYDSAAQKMVFAWRDTVSNVGRAAVGTVSGTSISFGSTVIFKSSAVDFVAAAYDSRNSKVVIAYRNSSNTGEAIVGTVSGTSISFGIPVVFDSTASNAAYMAITYDSKAQKVVVSYVDYVGSTNRKAYFVVGSVSGTSITFDQRQQLDGGRIPDTLASTYDSANQRVVMTFSDILNSYRGEVIVLRNGYDITNLTETNFLGFSDGAYSDSQTATIQLGGTVDDAQSGLTTTSFYYVQKDGTLSTTADSPSVSAGIAVSATEILIAPTSGDAAPGPTLSLISSATASNSANITFSLPSGYDYFVFEMENLLPSTDNVNFFAKVGSNPNIWRQYGYLTGSSAGDTNGVQLGSTIGNNSGTIPTEQGVSGTLKIHGNYSSSSENTTGHAHINYLTTSTQLATAGVGFQTRTAAADSEIVFSFFSSNITSGTIKMYGFKSS